MGTIFAESGTDATQAFQFFTHTVGTVSSSTAQARTGPRSVLCDSTAGNVAAYVGAHGSLADAGRRITFGFRAVTNLPSADAVIFYALDSSFLPNFAVYLRTTGKLSVSDGTTFVDGVATLAVNTWYHITVAYLIVSTTNWVVVVWVDGVGDIVASHADFTLPNASSFGAWWGYVTAPGASRTCHIDDLWIDDDAGLTFPGLVRVTYKAPTTTNTNGFDTNVGTQAVNERPISEANGKTHANTTDVAQNYNLQARSAGDVDITNKHVTAVIGWIWAVKGAGTGTGEDITLDGVDTSIALTTTSSLFRVYSNTNVYPAAAAGIGMRSTVGTADTTLYECGALIVYVEPIPGGAGGPTDLEQDRVTSMGAVLARF